MKPHVTKTHLKTIMVGGKYIYKIMLVDADGERWLEAQPVWKGVVRTAESEKILKIILENDAIQLNKEQQKVR